ncbi:MULTISPECIES: cbb3-type cytochrome oxidase assembly protein CcoS [unclassified Mesorhizobium]|uniref:cbb3-type cytochrome oxidase assembly protein CcoS n=1 Tax=unclassified Mesorhizobium TaxID=325217 RepID=UPI0009686B30|nr:MULTISPECIES: cbb3-type cytochrome oxidase assembly protein CcoS [unclassified Mesorhizobium]MBN9257473.1 cbb3-type cytochrome oxidase assembly protein CcoS [Mesorhizobium sp.]OJX87530.1 MAG: cytochrome oxidase maturation protein, cbb3-type [Mesorhizobium sp. 65-26]
MNSLVFLVPIALVLGAVALASFFWSMKSGQYEDLDGAGERVLSDEDRPIVDRPARHDPVRGGQE